MYNEKSLKLIKENADKFTKPSEILKFAHDNNIRQLKRILNDGCDGYCAIGFLTQYTGKGKEMFDINLSTLTGSIKDNNWKHDEYAPYRKVFLKEKVPISSKEFEKVDSILIEITHLNDNDESFLCIATYLQSQGF